MTSTARMQAVAPFRAVSFHDVAGMLAQTLGQEKSSEVVGVAAATLGYRGPLLTREEASNLLDHLARVPGLIGIAARFAQRRAYSQDDAEPPSSIRAVERPGEKAAPPSSKRDDGLRSQLVTLLSQALGTEKAEEEIAAAEKKLGFTGKLGQSQGIAILEELAKVGGAVGVTARFAKARFLLRK